MTTNQPEPPPKPNDGPHIADLVVADLLERKALGIQKYGTALQANNGRRALVDLYQELLDAAQYARQEIEERAILSQSETDALRDEYRREWVSSCERERGTFEEAKELRARLEASEAAREEQGEAYTALYARLEASERTAAAMREALERLLKVPGVSPGPRGYEMVSSRARAAIASDAGRDFESRIRTEEREMCIREFKRAFGPLGAMPSWFDEAIAVIRGPQ